MRIVGVRVITANGKAVVWWEEIGAAVATTRVGGSGKGHGAKGFTRKLVEFASGLLAIGPGGCE